MIGLSAFPEIDPPPSTTIELNLQKRISLMCTGIKYYLPPKNRTKSPIRIEKITYLYTLQKEVLKINTFKSAIDSVMSYNYHI